MAPTVVRVQCAAQRRTCGLIPVCPDPIMRETFAPDGRWRGTVGAPARLAVFEAAAAA